MTDEQIKQNAEAYADVFGRHMADYYGVKDAYIAGAHSRDEEIGRMKNEATAIMDEACALKTELDKLRNPWISVKERLPEKGQTCFLANFNKRRCGCGKFYTDDGIGARCERTEGNSTGVYFLNAATHWMPIPELKEGK